MPDKSTFSPDFDAVRAANPELGLSVYAIQPGSGVTLEIITPDQEIYTFVGRTLAEALVLAFPPADDETPGPDPAPTPDIFA